MISIFKKIFSIGILVVVSPILTSLACDQKSGCKLKSPIIEYKKALDLKISANGINRISFAPNIITTIWGDSSEYSTTLSDNGSELFLTSKVEAGNNIALAVEFSGGRVIDLLLHTIEVDKPQIIHLNLRHIESKAKILEQEAIRMLSAMRTKRTGKYYVREAHQQFNIGVNPSLVVEQRQIYQFLNLKGVVLTLKNKGKKAISINTIDVAKSFNNVIAAYSESFELGASKQAELFLVLEQKEI